MMNMVYDAAQAHMQAHMQAIVDDINAGKYAKLIGCMAAISADKRGVEVESAEGYTAGIGLTFMAYNSVDEVVNQLAAKLVFWMKDDVAR